MVAAAVDHAGLEDRVVEARVADQLLGRPLRLVVRRSAVGPRPQEAQHDDLAHPGPLRRLDHVRGALDVHPLVGLVADLAVDARAVRDDLAPLERSRECVDVTGVDAGAARDDDGCLGPEPFGQVASDESGAAGDRGAGGCWWDTW